MPNPRKNYSEIVGFAIGLLLAQSFTPVKSGHPIFFQTYLQQIPENNVYVNNKFLISLTV